MLKSDMRKLMKLKLDTKIDGDVMYMNENATIGIVPRYAAVETELKKIKFLKKTAEIPKLNYTFDGEKINMVRIDPKLLQIALHFCSLTEQSVRILSYKDSPMLFQFEQFDLYIAPKVEHSNDAQTKVEVSDAIYEFERLRLALLKLNVRDKDIEKVRQLVVSLLV